MFLAPKLLGIVILPLGFFRFNLTLPVDGDTGGHGGCEERKQGDG